jgi:hypothetical protein
MRESIVFLVRIWPPRSHDECFRASARRVDQEDARTFTQEVDLVRFLRSACNESPGHRAADGDVRAGSETKAE